MEPLLKGYNAFVTGAASGIGKAIAINFARHGVAGLAVADIDRAALDSLAASIAQSHPDVRVLPITLDVADAGAVKAAVAQTVQTLGRLEVAVNNAGIAGSKTPTHELSDEAWGKTLAVDLHGVFYCQREELAVMMAQEDLGPRRGRGVIINTASLYGLRAPLVPLNQTAYAASKHAVVGITKSDGIHYGPQGIRINAVCPGYVETPLIAGGLDSERLVGLFLDNSPIRRLINPDEVADGVVFLASPMSSAMHASTLSLDLGVSNRS